MPTASPDFEANYQRGRILGRGASGVAFIVQRKSDPQKHFVAKEICMARSDEKRRKEAENEYGMLKSLKHINIVRCEDIIITQEKDLLYIVMEHADGGDLSRHIQSKRSEKERCFFPENTVLKVFVQICSALEYLHSKRILHRDLKPANIFLAGEGELGTCTVKLGDFGIAKWVEATQANSTVGTPSYLSPEICRNCPYGMKADMWALGIVLYELMVLKVPFHAGNLPAMALMICTSEPREPVPDEFGTSLVEIAKSLLQKDPEKRPHVDKLLQNPYVKAFLAREAEPQQRGDVAAGRSPRAQDRAVPPPDAPPPLGSVRGASLPAATSAARRPPTESASASRLHSCGRREPRQRPEWCWNREGERPPVPTQPGDKGGGQGLTPRQRPHAASSSSQRRADREAHPGDPLRGDRSDRGGQRSHRGERLERLEHRGHRGEQDRLRCTPANVAEIKRTYEDAAMAGRRPEVERRSEARGGRADRPERRGGLPPRGDSCMRSEPALPSLRGEHAEHLPGHHAPAGPSQASGSRAEPAASQGAWDEAGYPSGVHEAADHSEQGGGRAAGRREPSPDARGGGHGFWGRGAPPALVSPGRGHYEAGPGSSRAETPLVNGRVLNSPPDAWFNQSRDMYMESVEATPVKGVLNDTDEDTPLPASSSFSTAGSTDAVAVAQAPPPLPLDNWQDPAPPGAEPPSSSGIQAYRWAASAEPDPRHVRLRKQRPGRPPHVVRRQEPLEVADPRSPELKHLRRNTLDEVVPQPPDGGALSAAAPLPAPSLTHSSSLTNLGASSIARSVSPSAGRAGPSCCQTGSGGDVPLPGPVLRVHSGLSGSAPSLPPLRQPLAVPGLPAAPARSLRSRSVVALHQNSPEGGEAFRPVERSGHAAERAPAHLFRASPQSISADGVGASQPLGVALGGFGAPHTRTLPAATQLQQAALPLQQPPQPHPQQGSYPSASRPEHGGAGPRRRQGTEDAAQEHGGARQLARLPAALPLAGAPAAQVDGRYAVGRGREPEPSAVREGWGDARDAEARIAATRLSVV